MLALANPAPVRMCASDSGLTAHKKSKISFDPLFNGYFQRQCHQRFKGHPIEIMDFIPEMPSSAK
jgi:hypothetical protein